MWAWYEVMVSHVSPGFEGKRKGEVIRGLLGFYRHRFLTPKVLTPVFVLRSASYRVRFD